MEELGQKVELPIESGHGRAWAELLAGSLCSEERSAPLSKTLTRARARLAGAAVMDLRGLDKSRLSALGGGTPRPAETPRKLRLGDSRLAEP